MKRKAIFSGPLTAEKRQKADRLDHVNIDRSGPLRARLERHAYERGVHFFAYMFYVRALVDYTQSKGEKVSWATVIDKAATHQVDAGRRSSESVYDLFDKEDVSVVDINSTSFCKMDATHINNVGIQRGWLSRWRTLASSDQTVALLLENAELMSGNTIQLPQKVNINPDRCVDKLHNRLVGTMITATPLVTRDAVRRYYHEATVEMKSYLADQTKKGRDGLAECAKSYLVTYTHVPPRPLTREEKRERMGKTVPFQLLPIEHTYTTLVGYIFGTFRDLRRIHNVPGNEGLPLRFSDYLGG